MSSDHTREESEVETKLDSPEATRRSVLTATGVGLAGMALASSITPTASGSDSTEIENTVSIAATDQNGPEVSDQLFGRLAESYDVGTIYPGIYSQHVKNPSFYPRSYSEDDFFGPKTFYDPDEIERDPNVHFPWEPIGGNGVSYAAPPDGAAAVATTDYQRVELDDARGGIAQKTVLPDFRTLEYDLAFSVRGDGVDEVTVSIRAVHDTESGHEAGEVLASTAVAIPDSTGWNRRELSLRLEEGAGDQYIAGEVATVDTPYGQYQLEFEAEGSGHVDLDWITLAAGDAVNGKFNPTTVELMREQDCTWLKWPGGNFTSQYNWRDGIGPLSERPTRVNHAWGGLEPNYFGTDEYLELCEVADLTPRITLGWNDTPPEWAAERRMGPSDAAEWVEYCNGSTETPMGALRAENGHPEPYDIEYWEIGNEVWGPWQMGHTSDPSEYASGSVERRGFNAYYDAMKSVDSSITILADGMDPGYEEAETPDPANWNGTLFEESGDRLAGLDLHRYNWGIESQEERDEWYETNSANPIDYNEVLVMFPTQFGELMAELSRDAADAGIENFRINVGEYGLFPAVDAGEPYPGPETMPGGAYIAGMLNAFIRQSDTVVEASQTWVPVRMFPPVYTDFPPDPNPLAPAGSVFGLYGAVLNSEDQWRAIDVNVSGDGRVIPDTGPRVRRMEDVPYVDAAAVRNGDDTLCLFATNRNLRTSSAVTLEIGDAYAGHSVEVVRHRPSSDERPLPHQFQASWEAPDVYDVESKRTTVNGNGTLHLDLDPAETVRLYVAGEDETHATVDDDGVWSGIGSNDADTESPPPCSDDHPGKARGLDCGDDHPRQTEGRNNSHPLWDLGE